MNKENFNYILQLTFKSFDHNILDCFIVDFLEFLKQHEIDCKSVVMLPIKIKKFTLIKAAFIHKRHREHFEIRTYTRLITINLNDKNTLFNIRNYIIPDLVELYKIEEIN